MLDLWPEKQRARALAYISLFQANLDLTNELKRDYRRVKTWLDEHPNDPARRRVLAKAFTAMAEGALYALKLVVLEAYRQGDCELHPKEYAMLEERRYFLADNGTPKETRFDIDLPRNTRFTISIYAKKMGATAFELDLAGGDQQGWQQFRKAIETRNRVVHPKSLEELTISTSELDAVIQGAEWFLAKLDDVQAAVSEVNRKKMEGRQSEQ